MLTCAPGADTYIDPGAGVVWVKAFGKLSFVVRGKNYFDFFPLSARGMSVYLYISGRQFQSLVILAG